MTGFEVIEAVKSRKVFMTMLKEIFGECTLKFDEEYSILVLKLEDGKTFWQPLVWMMGETAEEKARCFISYIIDGLICYLDEKGE